jgi:hypothetical protein
MVYYVPPPRALANRYFPPSGGTGGNLPEPIKQHQPSSDGSPWLGTPNPCLRPVDLTDLEEDETPGLLRLGNHPMERHAEAVATAEHLQGVEIVLAYDEPGCELALRVAFPGVRRT